MRSPLESLGINIFFKKRPIVVKTFYQCKLWRHPMFGLYYKPQIVFKDAITFGLPPLKHGNYGFYEPIAKWKVKLKQ